MESYPCPTVSCYFIWILLHSGRWTRKVSLWTFHSKEAGWCFVTGQNDTTNTWWNQDLQVGVQTPKPPTPKCWLSFYKYYLNVWYTCSEYFLYKSFGIQNFTIQFYFPTEVIWLTVLPLCPTPVAYGVFARPEWTNIQASRHCEEGVPRPRARLNMINSASQNPKDINAFYANIKSQLYNFSMTRYRYKGNYDDYYDIHIQRKSLLNLPHVWRNWTWNW